MLAVPDKLLKLGRDQCHSFGAVQDEAAGETALGEVAEGAKDELVLGM